MADIASSSGGPQQQPQPRMDEELLKAATCGDLGYLKGYVEGYAPGGLSGTTPAGNTCLHISCIHGHEEFCSRVLELDQSLLSEVNCEGETPLVIAVAHGYAGLVSLLLTRCQGLRLNTIILHKDKEKCNALHHAISNGHRDIALQLIAAEPALSHDENIFNESPMFMAVMRGFIYVFQKLLENYMSSDLGSFGRHALHAAAINGNQGETYGKLLQESFVCVLTWQNKPSPTRLAVCYNKVGVLQVLLKHDISLGYEVSNQGLTLLTSAATRGHVDVARELLTYCPDAPYRHKQHMELTCLHTAVIYGHLRFVEFIHKTPQLRQLINMRDRNGRTALHYAVDKCNPKIVDALLANERIDTTIRDLLGKSAASQLSANSDHEKSLDWKEVHALMLRANPQDDDICSYTLHEGVEQHETIESEDDRHTRATTNVKTLTQKYTSNTSLVAILLATITFTAAFTLPGGYNGTGENEGLPIMYKKTAFQVFLISDTLAMCSAFVVAFICLMGRWEDDRFTNYYITVTKKLTWFAYMATLAAFAAGLYTVLAHHRQWLAIVICALIGYCPCLTLLVSKWPILKLSYRFGIRQAFCACIVDPFCWVRQCFSSNRWSGHFRVLQRSSSNLQTELQPVTV